MGSVWSATHSVTGGRVALKFVKGAIDNPDMRRRFLREARVATLVEHPNVVQIRDVFDHDDTPVIVMDLLHGETLADRLDRLGRLELGEAARIAVSVIGAAGAAHEVGLIHRDLKPENVFLSKTNGGEVVRVLDFVIAKLVRTPEDELTTAVTQTGALIGTPAYMAPEQLFGETDLDHRVDVWSIGVMLHEMLTGVRPIDGENFGQIAKKLLSQPLLSIAAFRSDLPRDVVVIVDRMLVRERAERLVDLNEAATVLAPYGAAPKPSFGPPRTRPIMDSDAEARVVVTEAADPKAETVQSGSGRSRAHDPEASTMISSPHAARAVTPAPASPSSQKRLPVDTGDAQVAASRTMVSGATTRSRTRGPVLVGAALVAVAAVVGVVIAAKPGGDDVASGAASAKAKGQGAGAVKHAASASATGSVEAPPVDSAPTAAAAEPAPSGELEAAPAPSAAPSTSPSASPSMAASAPHPKAHPAVAPKAFHVSKPVASASAAASTTAPVVPPTAPTPTSPPGLVTASPF